MMKRHNFLLVLPCLFGIIFTSTSPYVPDYGGKIQINNDSMHNVYIVFQTALDTTRMLCLEKGEKIKTDHTTYREDLANPVIFYTGISLYDLDSGILLKKMNVNNDLFVLKSGTVDANNALFEFTINDDLWEGGL